MAEEVQQLAAVDVAEYGGDIAQEMAVLARRAGLPALAVAFEQAHQAAKKALDDLHPRSGAA